MDLCSEVDLLRKYAILNYLAVTKVVKKHDKVPNVALTASTPSLPSFAPRFTPLHAAIHTSHVSTRSSTIEE